MDAVAHACMMFFHVIAIGVIGLLLSIALVLPVAWLVKRFTRVPKERRQDRAAMACMVMTLSFTLFQSYMHFSMMNELEPLAKEFAADAHMEDGNVVVSDEFVVERNHRLRERGYIHLGRWWAAWDYDQPIITTDTILYLWIPFL